MARFALTDRFVQHAKPRGGRMEYFDETTRGLALRVSESGVKSWCFHYTTGGTRKRLTLGTYPATSLAKARALATEAKVSSKQARTQARSELRQRTRSKQSVRNISNAKGPSFAPLKSD